MEPFAALVGQGLDLRVSRGDMLANLALYMPLGLTLALALGFRAPRAVAVAVATLLCTQLSLLMEIAQLYTPVRVASLADTAFNAIGGLAGALAAPLLLRLGTGVARPRLGDHFALLLLACWMAGRLHPYLPSLDLGEWRASLAPLLREEVEWARAARLAVLWWLTGRLTEAAFPRAAWLVPPLVLGTLAAAVPIHGRVLMPAELAAGAAGLLLWAVLRRGRAGDALLVPAMMAVVVAEALAPYAFLAAPRDYSFIPFGAAIGGSLGAGMQALLYKALLSGGLIWALLRQGAGLAPALSLAMLLALGTSIAQRWLPDRSAEITDALIALAVGMAAWATGAGMAASGSDRCRGREGGPRPLPRSQGGRRPPPGV